MPCNEGETHADRLHDRAIPIAEDLAVALAGRPIDIVAHALAFGLSDAVLRETGFNESTAKQMRMLAEEHVAGMVMGCQVPREERLKFLLMLAYSVLFTSVILDLPGKES